jgi:hypothetical protein
VTLRENHSAAPQFVVPPLGGITNCGAANCDTPSLEAALAGQLSLDQVSISFFVLIVIIFFLVRREIQFNRIEADDLKSGLTLFTVNDLSLIHVFIDVDFRFTFRTTC